ncbi:MAG: tetratricopeptide repeat protein [Planctomycetota bacterium]
MRVINNLCVRRSVSGALAAVLLIISLSLTALADIIHLKNGNSIRGRIIRETADGLAVEVPYGEIFIKTDDIASIEREETGKYYSDEADRLSKNDDYAGSVLLYRKALKATPDDSDVRQRLHQLHIARIMTCLKSAMFDDARALTTELIRDGADDALSARYVNLILAAETSIDAFITQTIAELDAGQLHSSVEKLEKLLSSGESLRQKIALPLARGYSAIGHIHYKNGEFERAADVWGRAIALDGQRIASLGDYYINARLKPIPTLVNEGKLDRALDTVEECLRVDPLNAEARLNAGIICERLLLFEDACRHYSAGLREKPSANPSHSVAQTLRARLTEKLGIKVKPVAPDPWFAAVNEPVAAGDWLTLDTPHFRIRHHSPTLAALVADAAEYHYANHIKALKPLGDFNPGKKIKMTIYNNREDYHREPGIQDWSGGLARIRGAPGYFDSEILTYRQSLQFLKSTLAHELLHIMLHDMTGYSPLLPLSLHEGTAIYFEPTYRQNYFWSLLRGRLSGAGPLPSEKLLTLSDYPKEQDLFYAQSLTLVRYLVSLKSHDEYLRFLMTTADKGVSTALKVHYGMSDFGRLDERWLKWMKQ